MREAAAATETYPTPNVQNADGAKVEKCFWKWWWSLSAWGQGPVWILVTCMQRHPLLFRFVVLWFFFFFFNLSYLLFFWLHGIQDLGSPTRDWLCPLLTTTRENPPTCSNEDPLQGLPCWSSVYKTTLPMLGVWCLVRELDPMCQN